MAKFIIDLYLDGYPTQAEQDAAALVFIYDQLNHAGSGVKVERYNAGWISVNDQLPERSKYTLNTSVPVLLWDTWGQLTSNTDYNGTRRGYYHFDKQRWCFSPEDGITDFVSHWMPLPLPPTQE